MDQRKTFLAVAALTLLLSSAFSVNACSAENSVQPQEIKPDKAIDMQGYATIKDNLPCSLSQTAAHTYKIAAGSRFLVVCENGLSSSSAKVGDSVAVRLANDVDCDGQVVLAKSSLLHGSVSQLEQARSGLSADLPGKHWLNAQGLLGLQFNQVDTGEKQVEFEASPAPLSILAVSGDAQLPTVTDKQGVFSVFYRSDRYACINAGIDATSVATTNVGSAAAHRLGSYALHKIGFWVPAFMSGVAGAVSPSYASGHPEEAAGLKERSKGFVLGFAKGLPGGGVLMNAVQHGSDVSLSPGDEFIVELKTDAYVTL